MADQQFYTPTNRDLKRIENYAFKTAGIHTGYLEISRRVNVDAPDYNPEINILLISNHPDWEDTDLWDSYDNLFTWLTDVEMTDDGRGLFDFWVYDLGGELQTQVQVWVAKDSGGTFQITKMSENGMNEREFKLK